MADQSKDFLQKLRATFQNEAQEHLQEIVSNMVLLEQAEGDAQQGFIERILRRLHTFKGAARAVNLTELEALCHAMESVFSAARKSGRAPAPDQFDTIHQAAGLAQSLLQEPSGKTRNQAVALVRRLERLGLELGDAARPAEAEAIEAPAPALQPAASGETAVDAGFIEAPKAPQMDVVRVQSRHLDAIRYHAEALLSVELGLQQQIADMLALADDIAEQRDRMRIADANPVGSHQRRALSSAKTPAAPTHSATLDHHARNRTVEAEARINQFESRCRHIAGALGKTRRHFIVTRSKLMDATLEAALVPFSSALDQLPGLVRNLARSRGKETVLHIEGESVQIDRRILNVVREVLIHLVTNAVDHGIEPIEKRLAHGKSAAGTVRVKITQHGGNRVSVSVIDDGAGIDVDQVASAAAKARNLSADDIAKLNDGQKLHLALQTGVSTSPELTSVSGRGVGLAIVAEKVASVGGELLIENSAGAGCSFQLVLPVRLATLRGLVLQTRGSSYVFPLQGLESVRALKEGDLQTIENKETLLAAGRVIPVLRLGHLLGLSRSRSAAREENIAVIARAAGNVFALLVDEIVSEQEVLPKSLGTQLRRVRYITGATQLGDGSLVPILGLDDIVKYGLAANGGAIAASIATSTASRQKRIIVTEDSITSRLLLKHILESAGYHVDTAVDGLDALSKLRHEEFDVLVSDIEMPHMDGLTLTRHVRANPKTAELPVVLVTSLQSPDEKQRGLLAGADAYVVKGSFDQDNLVSTIRRLI